MSFLHRKITLKDTDERLRKRGFYDPVEYSKVNLEIFGAEQDQDPSLLGAVIVGGYGFTSVILTFSMSLQATRGSMCCFETAVLKRRVRNCAIAFSDRSGISKIERAVKNCESWPTFLEGILVYLKNLSVLQALATGSVPRFPRLGALLFQEL